MAEKASFIPQTRDIAVAISLLTRLPLHLPNAAYARGARAAWAYPLAGAVLGGIAGLAGWIASPLGSGFAALVVLAVTAILSGAMHEDGLADCADGFWGGWDPARRLDIMKDSQIGTYGVIALILSFATRWWALEQLISAGHVLAPLLAVGMMSRAGMPVLMVWLPNARSSGLSQSVGRPAPQTAGLGILLAVGVGLIGLGSAAFLAVFIAAAVVAGCGFLARTKIGGQTGDVLGASQQLTEIALLVTCTAVLS
ncbi:MAG: adenosylcobinamide-GDP ribazoletransferase [Thalassovita sp.]